MPTTKDFTVTKLTQGAIIENTTDTIKIGCNSSEEFAMKISDQVYSTLVSTLDSLATDATMTVNITITT